MSGQGVQEGIDPFSTPLSALDSSSARRSSSFSARRARRDRSGSSPRARAGGLGGRRALDGRVRVRATTERPLLRAGVRLLRLALLWLLQRDAARADAAPRLADRSLLVWPAWDNRLNASAEQERSRPRREREQYVDAHLAPGEFALVPSYWPFADSRYFELVQIYVDHSPDYPYRYLPATAAVRSFAQAQGMRPRFYIGPLASDLTVRRVELAISAATRSSRA